MLISLLVLFSLINVSYWMLLNRRVGKENSLPKEQKINQPITLVICVKNALHQLTNLLKRIDKLDTKNYDVNVLIVDDYSDTPLDSNQQTLICRYPIEIIKPDINIPGKKAAIMTGILACKEGVILLTDVDCLPSEQWVNHMVKATKNDRITLGYSPFIRRRTTVNKWARYENVITAIQYLGWALLGKPYMGVGRNMAFNATVISNLTLDDLHPSLPGGDDDMLVQYVGQADVCLDSDAFVFTEGPSSWTSYFAQKRRHYGISTRYPLPTKIKLSIYSLTQIGVLILSLVGLLSGMGKLVLIIWIVRTLLMLGSSAQVFKRLNQFDLWYWIPLLDVMLSLYYIVFGFTFLLPKSKQW